MTQEMTGLGKKSLLVAILMTLGAGGAIASDEFSHPINCDTAEGDLRALASEKKHAQNEQLKGATALTPSGALFGLVTGTEQEKLDTLSSAPEYIKQIDARTAAIKKQCNLE